MISNDSLFVTLLLLCFSCASFAQGKEKFKLPDALNEASGIIYYSQDSILWLNDGGNSPTLFLSNADGKILKKQIVPNTLNRDWEDLTYDDKGNVYIGDFGNNLNKRRDLTIYIFNPKSAILDSIKFNFPDQKDFPPADKVEQRFDMEAFFWKDDYLHLFSKKRLRTEGFAYHYRLSAQAGTQTAELIEGRLLKKRVITSAALSADGQKVVLLSYHFKRILGFFPVSKTSIFEFTNFKGNEFLLGEMKEHKVRAWIFPTQYESIDFCEENRVIIASERTAFIRARGRKIRLK